MSFHIALTRYDTAPGANPCLEKKWRSGRSRAILYRLSLFSAMTTGAVSALFDVACTVSAGCKDEEAEAATAGRLSAIAPKCGDLKCQSYC